MPTAGHQMRIRLMKKRSAGNQRYEHYHGVDLGVVFLAGCFARPHSQNSIFAVEIDGDSFGQMAGDEIGNSPPQINVRAIGQFERGTLRDLFARQTRLSDAVSWHPLFRNVVTRHSGFLSLARCDERRSRESRRVLDLWRRSERFLRLRRSSSWLPWPSWASNFFPPADRSNF